MAITERIAVVFEGDAKSAVGAAKDLEDATEKAAAAEEKAAASKAKHTKATLLAEKAALDLTAAERKAAKVTASSSATDEQKARAQLAVRNAELRHTEAVRQATTAEKTATKAVEQHATALKHVGHDAKAAGADLRGALKPAALAAGAALAVAGVKGVGAASDLTEAMSKAGVIFGQGADEVIAFGDGAAKSIGQSKRAAIDATSTFGDLLQGVGITREESTKLSISLVKLTSDLASFNNANPADVVEATTAAFRGEYDAIQRFVPTISAATVETRALADSHKKSASQLTANEKALATYSIIIGGATRAQGDFARTADGQANSQRILAANVENLSAKLGGILAPAAAKATGALNRAVGPVEDLVEGVGQLPQPVKAGAVGLLGMVVAAKAAAVAIPVVSTKTSELVSAVKGLKPGSIAASGGLAVLGITAGVLVDKLEKGKQKTRDFLTALDEAAGATTIPQQIEARRKAILDTNEATKLSENEKFRYVLSIKELQKQLDIESRAQKIVGEETHKAGQAVQVAATYTDRYGQTVNKTTGAISDQKTETEKLTYAIDRLNGANIDAAQAQLSFQSSLDTLRTSVGDNGKALVGNSEKARGNQKAFLDAAEAAITFSERVGDQKGYDAGRAALVKSQGELRKTGVQLGLSRAEVDKLIAAYLKIPPAKQTKIELDIERARKNAADIQRQISGVKGQRVDILVTAGGSIQRVQREIDALTGRVVAIQVGQVGHGARAFSKGGEVKGGVPGKDSVPALLTPGEYVLTEEQARGLRLGAGLGRGAGSAPPVNVVLQVRPGGTGLDRLFVDWLRVQIDSRGGNVQTVLGRRGAG